jgi:hypothetical protein
MALIICNSLSFRHGQEKIDLTLDRLTSQITHYAKGCGRGVFLRDSALIVGLHRSMPVSHHVARRCLSGDRAVQAHLHSLHILTGQ